MSPTTSSDHETPDAAERGPSSSASMPEEKRTSRIIVRLDQTLPGRAALSEAASLATRLNTELVGRFIEDDALLLSAAFPFATEITTSGERRKLTQDVLAEELEAQAIRAHHELRRAVQDAEIDWRFEIKRGRPLEELAGDAVEEDMLVVGSPSQADVAASPAGHSESDLARLVRAATTESHADILVVGTRRQSILTQPPRRVSDEGRHSQLDQAAPLRRVTGDVLAILEQLQEHPPAGRPIYVVDDGSSEAEICFHLATQLAEHLGAPLRRLSVNGQDAADIARYLRLHGAGMAIFPAGCRGLRTDTDTARMAKYAGCPVLFMGADRAGHRPLIQPEQAAPLHTDK